MSWRPHPKHASVNPSSPRAWGTSDRNGFISNLEDLRWQYDWAGTQLINKRFLVSKDELDEPQEQLRAIKIPPDPDPVLNARPEPYAVDEFQNTPLYAESGNVVRNPITKQPLIIPSTLPATTTTFLDFANGNYSANGVPQTIAQSINLPSRVVAGKGVDVICGSPVQMLGQFLSFMLTGQWTVIVTFAANSVALALNVRSFLMTIFDAGQNDQVALYTQTISQLFEDAGGGTTRYAASGLNDPVGPTMSDVVPNLIAYTRDTAHIATCLNGWPTVSVADGSVNNTPINFSQWTFPSSQVQIADGDNVPSHLGFIKRIDFYSVQPDNLLPALTIQR